MKKYLKIWLGGRLDSLNSPHLLITPRGWVKTPSENREPLAKYVTVIQSTSCHQSTKNASWVSLGARAAAAEAYSS